MTAHTLPSRSSSRAKPKKQLCTRAPRRKFARLMRVLMGKCRLVWKGKHSTKRFFSGARESKTSRTTSAPEHIWCLAGAETSDARRHRAVGNCACIRRERRKYAEQPGMGARHRAQRLAPQRNSRGRIG